MYMELILKVASLLPLSLQLGIKVVWASILLTAKEISVQYIIIINSLPLLTSSKFLC
jgi:hypothetical protein